jgi:hypothetical protein
MFYAVIQTPGSTLEREPIKLLKKLQKNSRRNWWCKISFIIGWLWNTRGLPIQELGLINLKVGTNARNHLRKLLMSWRKIKRYSRCYSWIFFQPPAVLAMAKWIWVTFVRQRALRLQKWKRLVMILLKNLNRRPELVSIYFYNASFPNT